MIIAKPKTSTLFSLGVFVTLSLGIAGYTAYYMHYSPPAVWYQYLIIITLTPLALGLTAKVILGYKVIKVAKGKLTIHHTTRFKKQNYTLKAIESWWEQEVKTAGGLFKELTIVFDDRKKLHLSYQEHTNYAQVAQYLRKKCANKMRKT